MTQSLFTCCIISVLFITGCSSSPNLTQQIRADKNTLHTPAEQRELPLFSVYENWQGVPYRWGGTTQSGVDCSAFVQIAYREAWDFQLPRTTTKQSHVGIAIKEQQAKYGDLVFFKIGRKSEHVGIYLGNHRFMHASSSKGVIISRLDNPYWANTFWQFRRIRPN
ncbi:peptidase P60 [Vibrio sp. CAIM 722]|uniref:Peptidase P60 n=1 Tax=Vibrio eleionomae TaxID=2653505 RepID=A0A7X4LK21_9VIBR|nr:NlpC/P60 family protein [Vibrio eleionomae]MZI93215.1 peptidase P60 [Vibrio eleionomae]